MIDKNRFFSELDALGRNKIKDKVTQHVYRKNELRLVQEWFRAQPDRDFKTWVYHPLKDGGIVMFSEAMDLYQKGWTDAPRKFPAGLRGLWYKIVLYFHPRIDPEKPDFLRMKRTDLKRYAIGSYDTNPQHSIAAQIELDRRDHRLKIAGIVLGSISAIYIFFQLFHYFFPESPSTVNIPNITNQEIKTQTNVNSDNNVKKRLHTKSTSTITRKP